MNQVIDTIHNRRSVRFYEDKKLTKEEIQTIIDAGNMAPTGSGQSWRFVAVTNDEILEKMRTLAKPKYEAWMKNAPQPFKEVRAQIDAVASDPVYYSAPAVIFVISSGMTADFDCSMVCENMMLAARSMEIGSCWVYFGQLIVDEPEIIQMLQIKENEKVYGPIILGYPKGEFPPAMAPKKAAKILYL